MSTYIVYCQTTTHGEHYEYKRFSDHHEAETCAEQLNDNPYRDVNEYFFVRAE